MRIFISGGCKNGKSTWAQRLAKAQQRPGEPLFYVATMCPGDAEDVARIARHVAARAGAGFSTVELPREIGRMTQLPPGSCLLDSLTALLANEMFTDRGLDTAAPARVAAALAQVCAARTELVVVSDYLYSDAVWYGGEVAAFQKGLALLDKTCAGGCDVVVEVCGGQLTFHKGAAQWEALRMGEWA